jgi:hypothetical protein
MHNSLAFGVTSLLAAVAGIALWQEPAPRADALVEAAQQLVAALPAELRAKACRPADAATRTQWNFVPQEYPGAALGELDAAATARVHALLRAVLSAAGHGKVEAIIALEKVLRELEQAAGRDAAHRDPGRYWICFHGAPAAQGAWSFQLQGHHVSLHFAVRDGALVGATPAFLGANPHQIPSGPHRGERILVREEELARALLALCTPEQKQRAVIAAAAPADIILGPQRAADGLGAPQGLPHSAMDALQKQLLWRLIEEYVQIRREGYAEAELRRIDAAGRDGIHFAWAGGEGRGVGHYYRIHGPTFVIEYDNTQNDSNHVHTVFRDLEHDFGGDLLRQHLERDHGRGR